MADDVTLNPGSGGAVVSTEQLTSGGDSSHAQRIKVITGAAHVDGGDVTTSNGLPVAQVDNAGNVIGVAAHPTVTKVSDGTNIAAVKPASTAPATTDPALVVAISPNSSLTASNPSVGATAAAVPADATMIGGPDGSGNLRAPVVKPADPATTDQGLVVRPIQGTPANLQATVSQGPAAALGSAWPVEVTDGTHTLPTADAAARALFAKVTDGTNTLPTGDAVARSINVQVNDGTNVLGTAAHPVQVNVTNGTQSLPTGDAQARAIQVTPGDGTRSATFKAASTAAAATDTSQVVALSPNSPIPYPSRTAYSTIAAASLVVKTSAGSLYSIRIRNRSASPVYAMVFNSTTVPADGTVTPALPPFLVPAGADVSFGTDYFTDSGVAFSTGISIAVSTTDSTTKTLATTAANHDISGAFT